MPVIQSQPRPTTGGPTFGAIVVGVDGSDSSVTALRWAAGHARAVGARLCVVQACREPVTAAIALSPPPDTDGLLPDPRRARPGRRVVTAAVAEARLFAPEVEVCGWAEPGRAAEVLVSASAAARLLVVGSPGPGRLPGSLTGSAGLPVAGEVNCPTVVVSGKGDANGPVVVAVDGAHTSAPALRFAFSEAARRHVGLIAVHAWSRPVVPAGNGQAVVPARATDPARAEMRRAAGRLLAAAVAPCRAAFPHVAVSQLLLENKSGAALPQGTEGAVLAVVGSHGSGPVPGPSLGSTGQAILAGADCPVAVVRGRGIRQ